MSAQEEPGAVRVIEQGGPGGRAVLRRGGSGEAEQWIIGGFKGPALPTLLSGFSIESAVGAVGTPGRWRLHAAQGAFEFEARVIEYIQLRPALFDDLHRAFALTWMNRLAVHALLALLRLPGGERLLSRWHSRRNA